MNELMALVENQNVNVDLLNDEDGDEFNRNALHLAASNGHNATIEFLLEKGAYLRSTCKFNENALHVAARNGQTGIIKLLLEKGLGLKTFNLVRENALHLAAQNGHNATIEFLLTKQSFLNSPTGKSHK